MKTKLKTITTLAVLGIIVPFLGFPLPWKLWLSSILALAVAIVAYSALARDNSITTPKKSEHEEPLFADKHPSLNTEEEDSHEE